MSSRTAAVLGAGTMGAGIAGVLASRGWDVRLASRREATLTAARDRIAGLHGGSALDRVTTTTDVVEAARRVDLVSENVAEELDVKRELLAAVEPVLADGCLVTTNTSSVRITAIGEALARPERLVGLHWFNPPHVMPLVEVVRGQRTADAAVTDACTVAAELGKRTVVVEHDVPGFLVNRLQYALLREAVHLVEQGICSAQDADLAVESTLAPRWAALGPLALMDLAGLDVVEKVSDLVLGDLSTASQAQPLVRECVAGGRLGTKTGSGFHSWTPETAAAAAAHRDATVRLLTERSRG